MKVLVACEYSGIVREAFREQGHDAWSCDIIPCSDNGIHHLVEDALNVIHWQDWDLMIAHPPCTHLAVSGNRWFADGSKPEHLRTDALDFVQELLDADIPRIALENPVGVISSRIRKPDQYIQPYEYGHTTRKKTGLWLKNLPLLEPTNIVEPELVRYARKDGSGYTTFSADYGGSSPTSGHRRSKFFKGIAEAMANQWGNL